MFSEETLLLKYLLRFHIHLHRCIKKKTKPLLRRLCFVVRVWPHAAQMMPDGMGHPNWTLLLCLTLLWLLRWNLPMAWSRNLAVWECGGVVLRLGTSCYWWLCGSFLWMYWWEIQQCLMRLRGKLQEKYACGHICVECGCPGVLRRYEGTKKAEISLSSGLMRLLMIFSPAKSSCIWRNVYVPLCMF